MRSWRGQSCRKTVRHFEFELSEARMGRAVDRNGDPAEKGVLPRPEAEIEADLQLWRSRLAGPEPKEAPEVLPEERPSCRQCGQKLRPSFRMVSKRVETNEGYYTVDEPGELEGFGYMARGHFCSLRCGWRFAVDHIEETEQVDEPKDAG